MPREPAYAAKRSQDGEALAASERAEATMAEASDRRRGTGSPEPAAGPHRSRDGGFLAADRQVRIAHAMAASGNGCHGRHSTPRIETSSSGPLGWHHASTASSRPFTPASTGAVREAAMQAAIASSP